MSGRIAVVTGGAGFIGHHLVQSLLAEGTTVRVIDPAPRPAGFEAGIDYRMASILDRPALEAVFAGAVEIYHVAAVAHLWVEDYARYEQVNVEGTRLVLDAAAAAKVPNIVVTSTETMLRDWRDRSGRPIVESDPVPQPERLSGRYSRSKAKAHAIALDAAARGQPIRIVFPTIPVGPGDEALTPPTVMVRDFLTGATPAFLNSLMNFVPVEDAARGHILAARRGEPGGRYILAGRDLWLAELMGEIERVARRPMPHTAIPYWLAYASGVAMTFIADHITHTSPKAPLEGVRLAYSPRPVDGRLAQQALGFEPGPVSGALSRLIDWLKRSGHLPQQAPIRRSDSQAKPRRVDLAR